MIVKSSNSYESGNDPCKTRWKRPELWRGNQGKAQTIQAASFHRRLASSNLFLSSFVFFLSSLANSLLLSPSTVLSLSLSFSPSIPILASDTFSPRAFALFIVSVSFQAFRTVYKVEALNWKPRLCRRYCGFSFLPFRFRRVCCLPLPFYSLRPHFCPLPFFLFQQRWRTVTLAPSREGSPWRREDRSPLQLTLGPDLLNVLFPRQSRFHRLQLNLQSRKRRLLKSTPWRNIISLSECMKVLWRIDIVQVSDIIS